MGAMINIPFNNKLGLGRVSIHANDLFFFLNFTTLHFRCWWSDLSSKLQRFLSNFLLFPFRFSLYPFLLVGSERYFRLVLYISIKICKLQVIMFSFDSFQDASANGFIATLQRDSEYKMGCIHAAYGNTYSLNICY